MLHQRVSSLPEWFPPMYARECLEGIACGALSIEWARAGVCIPQVGDFLFDPWFNNPQYDAIFQSVQYVSE